MKLSAAASGARSDVVVVGAINVDFVVAADRLPAAGETVVGRRLERHGGGKGANGAVAAARAGAAVSLVGAVGADDIGRIALEELRAAGVETENVVRLERESTGAALIVVDGGGENQVAVAAGANAAVRADHVEAVLERFLPGAGCVLVSTEIAPEAVTAAVRCACAQDVVCVLNPAPPVTCVLDLLALGAILTPNVGELSALARMFDRSTPEMSAEPGLADMVALAQSIVARTNAPLVVTMGSRGALIVKPDGSPEQVAAHRTVVRDTTGAGDTFNGVLAARLAQGDTLSKSARWATVAASLSVSEFGARGAMPTLDELKRVLARTEPKAAPA